MFVVRDIMLCKPGKVRPMVDKFVALSKLGQKMGFSAMRVMTDVYHDLIDSGRREIYQLEK